MHLRKFRGYIGQNIVMKKIKDHDISLNECFISEFQSELGKFYGIILGNLESVPTEMYCSKQ